MERGTCTLVQYSHHGLQNCESQANSTLSIEKLTVISTGKEAIKSIQDSMNYNKFYKFPYFYFSIPTPIFLEFHYPLCYYIPNNINSVKLLFT